MASIRIRLTRAEWEYDPAEPLGKPGGFGAVYVGRATDGRTVAIKRLHIDRLGVTSREIEVAKFLLGHTHPHVIGMLDVGRDSATDAIFLVMERAQQSLQNLINDSAPIATTDALEIVDAIAAGLEEIGELIHRDLKPDNVLLHNGVWKLADLGLARFIEETTAPNTMKGFLTLPYCAPEQCRMERATKATDVYALGAILYALLTGQPPFPGPTQEEYFQQHQFDTPPTLKAPSAVQQLGLDCLAKNPLNRPSLANLRIRVHKARTSLGVASPTSGLSAVGATIAESRARQEAETLLAKKAATDRRATAKEAIDRLNRLLTRLTKEIKVEASAADIRLQDYPIPAQGLELEASSAEVSLELGKLGWIINWETLPSSIRNDLKWDILAVAYIEASSIITWSAGAHQGRSANLFFGKLSDEDGYRWWEVSLRPMPQVKMELDWDHFRLCPYAVVDKKKLWRGDQHFYWPLGEDTTLFSRLGSNEHRLSADPVPVDGEFEESFVQRWGQWLAYASLVGPQKTPFNPLPPIVPISPKFLGGSSYNRWHYPEFEPPRELIQPPAQKMEHRRSLWKAIVEWLRI
jgi:eukaryotic-like serine/threonine-protein kinase